MYEKPLYLTPDGYRRLAKNPFKYGNTSANADPDNLKKQMLIIEKYRNMLHLPVRNSTNTSKQRGPREVVISEQAAKLIALSIKGLLNS